MNESAALTLLLAARNLKDARRAVDALRALGFEWAALGEKEGNFGLVNIGSDPGFAFVERITNAIDALVDHAAAQAPPPVVASLDSPRAAVAALFGVPEGRMVHADTQRQAAIARGVRVTIADGSLVARPTLEVRDTGTGLTPDTMPSTILNLAGSNKIGKRYLAGAYGQGGSTTFAFSPDGAIVASATDESDVGVTFVRYRELDARKNKNGRYEYLIRRGGGVARIKRDRVAFARGTLVRHFDYDLGGYTADARLPERSLLALAQTALFDPILPFTIVESRARFAGTAAAAPEIVYAGRFARLTREAGASVEYAQSTAIPLEPRGADNVAAAHYWVLTGPNALLHPDPRSPIVMTNFGQTHGVEERRVIVDALRLPFLKNDLIVQIELDGLSAGVKRELLSTTRDRLKRGSRYTALLDAIVEALGDDPQLQAANTRRRLQLLDKQHKSDHEKLRRRFAELIEKFRPGEDLGAKRDPAGTNGSVAGTHQSGESAGAEPLPTLAHPTFLRIARGSGPLELRSRRRSVVTVESDAPDGYLAIHGDARLIAVDPTLRSVAFIRASDFRGGRARLSVRADLPVAGGGTIGARLTDAHGNVFADAAPYVVVAQPAPEPAGADGNARVRVPDIYEVRAAEWPKFGFNAASVARAVESADDYSILVNMDNRHLRRLLTTSNYQTAGMARMQSSFLVQVAFYTFLQHEGRATNRTIDDVTLEAYQLRELDRVAQTVVTSIASVERIDSAALFDAE